MEFKHKLLLIDGHALLHRAYHAIPGMTSPSGFPTGAIYGFLSMFFKALADIKPTHALVVFDVPGPTFRDKIATDYKAHRKPADKEMIDQLPKVKEILQALNIPVYEKTGFEADDLLGIIADKTPKDMLNIIVTGDLDLLQLIDNHTQVYRFKIGFSDIQIFDMAKMVEVYGLNPSQWVDYKAIRGDTSDNIPGVPGIGEKGALELIKTFGSLEEVYEAVQKNDQRIKPGILKKLIAGKDKAILSQKLAHINQKHEIDFNLSDCKMREYNLQKVLETFKELGIKALINRLPKYNSSFPQAVEIKKPTSNHTLIIKNLDQALIAAYLLNPGRREYDVTDENSWTGLERDLKEKELLKIFQEIEVPLITVLKKMENRGIKLNLDWLEKMSRKMAQRIDELTIDIHKIAGLEFNIASPLQLREVLFEKLNIPTDNLRKTSKTRAYSTDAQTLEKLRGLHPIIDMIFEYREIAKLKSTYVDALPKLVSQTDGRLHTSYNQTVAATGRLSSSEPNLQNIPIRSDLGNQVRKAFIAEKGKTLLSLDYSQIELRIAASLSGDKEMINIFKNGGDFHSATASKIFGVAPEKVTPAQRRDAKTINFSVLYGVSSFGLSERSNMSRFEAQEFIKKYYQIFKGLKQYLDDTIEFAHKNGFTINPLNRIRYYPEIHASNFAVRNAAERAAINMPMQSLAADILKMAMIRVDGFLQNPSTSNFLSLGEGGVAHSAERGQNPDCQMLLTVHDELLFEVDPKLCEKYAKDIKDIMENVYKLDVPIIVEAKAGPNWLEMEKLS
jgi:DNA polymerase-1